MISVYCKHAQHGATHLRALKRLTAFLYSTIIPFKVQLLFLHYSIWSCFSLGIKHRVRLSVPIIKAFLKSISPLKPQFKPHPFSVACIPMTGYLVPTSKCLRSILKRSRASFDQKEHHLWTSWHVRLCVLLCVCSWPLRLTLFVLLQNPISGLSNPLSSLTLAVTRLSWSQRNPAATLQDSGTWHINQRCCPPYPIGHPLFPSHHRPLTSNLYPVCHSGCRWRRIHETGG